MPEQQTLKPQLFVTRQNGVMVPLIAMDELPIHVQIRNVPRVLDSYNMAGMMGVGVFEARHQYYVVDALNSTKPLFIDSIHAPPSVREQAASPKTNLPEIGKAALAARPVLSAAALPKAFGIGEQPTSDAASNSCTSSNIPVHGESQPARNINHRSVSPASAVAMPASKPAAAAKEQDNAGQAKAPVGCKEYCSFWIRRGECDYAQQGCVYKHEMPLDLPTLERIGHRDIPRWYREKYGLGSLLVAGGKSVPSYGVVDAYAAERKWRVGDDAKRMIRHGLGVSASGHGTRHHTGNNHKSYSCGKARPSEAEKAKEGKEKGKEKAKGHQRELVALKLNEAEEKERKALAAKYKVLRPDHRSIFDHDLDSDSFSNGQEPDDLMAKIRAREQAGWEREKAEAACINASVASATVVSMQANSGRGQRGARRRGGGQRRRTETQAR
ncbi:hypothetical protein A1O3_01861 [Capronia epimyces CBS 606.96]|uniref:C3H1-type domain-containing protein n=1 Tax=Capronia epimyces CBS 606.96 TaxID=1182542 RepID=W9Y7H3_9EURO|nr:uncharacterized protein A1O3_01861 [Capronia epimyces CBS 606.96]EXJ88797.1 hypothetical protein A1O3_01861 [Capronia epimyces CBS 606.96]